MGQLLLDFYAQLYVSDQSSSLDDLEGIIDLVITDDENDELIRIPNKEEICAMLGKMKVDKAPGSDGMTTLFSVHFWEIVGEDVVRTVQQFFE